MNCWLRIAIATVTCLSVTPITCLGLPLHHDVAAEGGDRRELLRGTWMQEPSGGGAATKDQEANGLTGAAATSLRLGKPRGSSGTDTMLDLLMSLEDGAGATGNLYGRQQQHDVNDQQGVYHRDAGNDAAAAIAGQKRSRQSKVDDYGHGMFWGKRGSSWIRQDELKAGLNEKQAKRANDEYGFGLFFGKRAGNDYDDFTL